MAAHLIPVSDRRGKFRHLQDLAPHDALRLPSHSKAKGALIDFLGRKSGRPRRKHSQFYRTGSAIGRKRLRRRIACGLLSASHRVPQSSRFGAAVLSRVGGSRTRPDLPPHRRVRAVFNLQRSGFDTPCPAVEHDGEAGGRSCRNPRFFSAGVDRQVQPRRFSAASQLTPLY